MAGYTEKRLLVDIGVNLTSKRFQSDLDQVIQRALQAGVDKLIITGTSVDESELALTIQKLYPQMLYSTAGIHPHNAKEFDACSIQRLDALLAQPSVVAVGETGLDYNRNFSEPSEQRNCFEQQLILAADKQMPVFLHQRDAHEDFVMLLSRYIDQLPSAVAHCFTGSADEMEAYLDMGLYIGITGWICDERRGAELKKLVNQIPLERLMIETDAPYLLPRDIRPKPKPSRNEPAFLSHICQVVSECYQLPYEVIAEHTAQNSQRVFNL